MPVYPQQLSGRLERGLDGAYLVAGNEPLLVNEAADAVRAAARAQGFAEREVLDAGPRFDWGTLASQGNAPSLFASQRLLELRLPGGKPGNAGSAAVQEWLKNPPEDVLLLIVAHDFEPAQARSKWVKAVESAGCFVHAPQLDAARLPAWIKARMNRHGLEPSTDAVRLLAERTEGNLLAADQEIEKLALLVGEGNVDEAAVLGAVADSARFQVFGMLDDALAGDAARALRALRGLHAEGIELPAVMGAVTWQLNQLARVAFASRRGGVDAALAKARVWPKKRELMAGAIRRHPPGEWPGFVEAAARIDRQVKGRAPGDPWQTVERLVLSLSGGAK